MLLMDEVLPEAALSAFSIEVFLSFPFILLVMITAICVHPVENKLSTLIICMFQAAHVAVKQYIDSRFSHLLLTISGTSYCFTF